jgi:hypothetical protein
MTVTRCDVSSAHTRKGIQHFYHVFAVEEDSKNFHHLTVTAEQYAQVTVGDDICVRVYEKDGILLYEVSEFSFLPPLTEQLEFDYPVDFEFTEEVIKKEVKEVPQCHLSSLEREKMVREEC